MVSRRFRGRGENVNARKEKSRVKGASAATQKVTVVANLEEFEGIFSTPQRPQRANRVNGGNHASAADRATEGKGPGPHSALLPRPKQRGGETTVYHAAASLPNPIGLISTKVN